MIIQVSSLPRISVLLTRWICVIIIELTWLSSIVSRGAVIVRSLTAIASIVVVSTSVIVVVLLGTVIVPVWVTMSVRVIVTCLCVGV